MAEKIQHWYVVDGNAVDGDFRCSKCGLNFFDPTNEEENGECDERLVSAEEKRVVEADQKSFEESIKKDPADMVARGVYADWLEDRKDPPDPKYARGLRAVPNWFISDKITENHIKNYLPSDLRQRCIMWLILQDMFPDYEEKDFRIMFQTTQILQEMLLKILALAEQE